MKRKGIRTLLVIAALLVFPAATVFADDLKGADNWAVSYDGSTLSSNFTSGEVSDLMSNIQPGDSLTVTVGVNNTGSDAADFWLSNEVVNSFEDNEKASGGAYSYRLVYTDSKGKDTVLYTSESVGGDDTTGGEGLYQATSATEAFFYLEEMAAGGKGKVTLKVQLEGETQGNTYQDATAAVELTFAAEPAAKAAKQPSDDSPKTGDPTNLLPFCIAAILAGLVLLFLGLGRLKRAKEADGND